MGEVLVSTTSRLILDLQFRQLLHTLHHALRSAQFILEEGLLRREVGVGGGLRLRKLILFAPMQEVFGTRDHLLRLLDEGVRQYGRAAQHQSQTGERATKEHLVSHLEDFVRSGIYSTTEFNFLRNCADK